MTDTRSDLRAGTRILLARHAETSAPDRFHGAESDIGLSARGLEQAEQLGRWLEDADPKALYTSAMRRAVLATQPTVHSTQISFRVPARPSARR